MSSKASNSSILFSETCDYLKVRQEMDVNTRLEKPLTFVLDSETRQSTTITYKDNQEFSISFQVYNNNHPGFKALNVGNIVIFGGNEFKITSYTKQVNGAANASVTAQQIVNVDFQNVIQPRKLNYATTKTGSSNNDNKNVAYLDLDGLLNWFKNGTDMQGFTFNVHGYFPTRPISDAGKWDGKQLLTSITTVWPGTVIVGKKKEINIYGFQKERDKNGNLQNVLDVETGERVDAMLNARSMSITRDISTLCNAIEVQSASYTVNNNNEDESEEDQEFTFDQYYYFKNHIAYSKESVENWGFHPAKQALANNFTDEEAADDAAREAMVTEPTVSITGTIDRPGDSYTLPVIHGKYTVGLSQENETYHVMLVGFTAHPFDSSAGTSVTYSNLGPSILSVLKTINVHDQEMSPVVKQIKDAIDNNEISDAGKNDDYSDYGDSSGDIDSSHNADKDGSDPSRDTDKTRKDKEEIARHKKILEFLLAKQRNTDNIIRRKSDFGRAVILRLNSLLKYAIAKPNAHLPISDRGTNSHFSKFGGLTLNEKNKSWNVRVTDDDHLKHLRDGMWKPHTADNTGDEDDQNWRHLMKADYQSAGGSWVNEHGSQNYYVQSDWYLGQMVFANSGLITTTAPTFTLRSNVTDDDYVKDWSEDGKKNENGGTLKRVWKTDKNDPHLHTINDASDDQPGELAGLQLGRIRVNHAPSPMARGEKKGHYRQGDILCDRIAYKTSFHYSLLSMKKNVKELSKSKALNTILNTDIAEYQYKNDKSHEKHASVIIDDVHDKSQWKTPKAFIAGNGTEGGRKDDVTVGYLVKAIQALQDQINDLKDENKDLKKQLNDLKG